MKSLLRGRPTTRKPTRMLTALLLSSVLMVSGCAFNSPMPKSAASEVVVDPTLMEKPNYTQTLLDFLSDKQSEPTSK